MIHGSRIKTQSKSKLQPGARRKIARAVDVLEAEYGIPTWNRKDPIDELIVTILSQNTNDANRDRGYRRLRERFPDWAMVRDAKPTDIADAIRPAGLAASKSVRIKAILQWVESAFGSLGLDALNDMTDDEVIELLTSQKGVGVKTAAVLLAFSLDRDLCPVDTHVQRIAQRLGWVATRTSAEDTFHALRPAIPRGRAQTFHLNLLKFGRGRCSARNPRCHGCPLWNDCVWTGKRSGG